MNNGVSNFMGQVQDQLNELGSTPALSADEQDTVLDFHEQDFSARRCAESIVGGRAAK